MNAFSPVLMRGYMRQIRIAATIPPSIYNMSKYCPIFLKGSKFSYKVKVSPKPPTSSRFLAYICAGACPIPVDEENSSLLTDAAAGEIVSKVRIRAEMMIRKFSSFRFLWDLISFCTEGTPFSNRGDFRTQYQNQVIFAFLD